MKKLICILAACMLAVSAFAQEEGSLFRMTLPIAEVEINDGEVTMSVLDMPSEESLHHYYLCVGTLGIGDDFVQLQIDPLYELFIDLGDTLEGAQAQLETFKDFAKQPAGTVMETVGVLALANPSTGIQEPVYVTSHRFLFQRILEFSVHRNGYVRATHISRLDFGSIVSSVKLYRKIHPSEK